MSRLSDKNAAKLLAWFDTLRDNPIEAVHLVIHGPTCSGKTTLRCAVQAVTGSDKVVEASEGAERYYNMPERCIELEAVSPEAGAREWIEAEVAELWLQSRNRIRNFYSCAITAIKQRGSVQDQHVAATSFTATDDDDAKRIGEERAALYFPKNKGYKRHFVTLSRAEIVNHHRGSVIECDPRNQSPAPSWNGHFSKEKRHELSGTKPPETVTVPQATIDAAYGKPTPEDARQHVGADKFLSEGQASPL